MKHSLVHLRTQRHIPCMYLREILKKRRLSYKLQFFFLNDPAPTEIYTLSLHDALPICRARVGVKAHQRAARTRVRQERFRVAGIFGHDGGDLPQRGRRAGGEVVEVAERGRDDVQGRSEEHTSELQSRGHLVCRLLLEKK